MRGAADAVRSEHGCERLRVEGSSDVTVRSTYGRGRPGARMRVRSTAAAARCRSLQATLAARLTPRRHAAAQQGTVTVDHVVGVTVWRVTLHDIHAIN